MSVVIYSEAKGVFLGTWLGLSLWSKFDHADHKSAVTFASEQVANEFIATWKDKPADIRCVAVEPDEDNFASEKACRAAGLPGWLAPIATEEGLASEVQSAKIEINNAVAQLMGALEMTSDGICVSDVEHALYELRGVIVKLEQTLKIGGSN
jgi:hypothetical protein